ncbi:MMPL family transporter [Streptomyces zagrosensis]|uniref:RND superfamily putative drug exporter n=1 Tax=Streptomyces zagrosensis TaxID=1042984 RepID=A0A7W9Q442_9ACTN|nr:MMPL family transporter [Streptomyces zagrosensis]MBB5933051.1 RND superfamily putative drug exporter [Streptomyces zagrosensis]
MVALWIVILAVAMPFAGKMGGAQDDKAVNYLPASADSTRVAELQEAMPGGDTTDLVLVYHRDGGLTAADRASAGEHVAQLADTYEFSGGQQPKAVDSKDGATVMYGVSLNGLPDEEDQNKAVDDIRDVVDDHPQGLSAEVGGSGALGSDANKVFESVDGMLMLATAAVVALLLILTYRSPFLWLVPLVAVGVATMTAMAVVYGLSQSFDVTITGMSSAVMTVLVFGAGTDYALLITARYREELRRHPRPYDAMIAAIRGCGAAVIASSGTVAAGLLCLLAADLSSSKGLGPVGAAGVVCALAVMMTLLPAILVLLGRRVFWPLIPAYGSTPTKRRSMFAAMGGSVSRRPITFLVGGVALLGALALGSFNAPGALKQEDMFTSKPESVSALETLADAYPEQGSQPITILARTGSADAVLDKARAQDGIVRAERGRSGDGWTEINAFAKDAPESAGEVRAIKQLRTELGSVAGGKALVGGASAEQIDLEKTNADDRMVVIPLVMLAVLLILIVLLRSLIASVMLVLAVVAVWGAATGLGGLFFEPVFGLNGIDPGLSLLTFVFLVALGVDYGIFLMHRMREEAMKGASTPQAALTALHTTGGVIASAGLVLAATFAVLATMPMTMMLELGFIIAVGVLLDTFLVRTYLVTSASLLLGRWIWWPGKLFRRQSAQVQTGAPERVSEPVG